MNCLRNAGFIGVLFLGIKLVSCTHKGDVNRLLKVKDTALRFQGDSCCHYLYQYNGEVLNTKVVDTLNSISVVKKSNRLIDSSSGHQKKLDYLLDTFRNKISVIAYLADPEHNQIFYRFIIDPGTFEIKVSDIDSGKYISLEEYQKLDNEQATIK